MQDFVTWYGGVRRTGQHIIKGRYQTSKHLIGKQKYVQVIVMESFRLPGMSQDSITDLPNFVPAAVLSWCKRYVVGRHRLFSAGTVNGSAAQNRCGQNCLQSGNSR